MSASPFHVCLYVVRCDDVSVVSAVWRLCGVLCVRVGVCGCVGGVFVLVECCVPNLYRLSFCVKNTVFTGRFIC